MRPRLLLGLAGVCFIASTAFASTGLVPVGQVTQQDIPKVQVLASGAADVQLLLELPAVAVEPLSAGGQDFQNVAIPGGGVTGNVGEPAIPVFTRLVQIPDDAGVTVTAVPEDVEEIPGVNLVPIQSDEGSAFAYDIAAYGRDSFGPGAGAACGTPGICRDRRVVALTFSPVSYNPSRKVLRIARRMRVEVRFSGHDYTNANPVRHEVIPSSFDRLYRALIVNYEGPAQGERVEDGTYLVICPNDATVIAKLQPLLDWRKRKGTPVRLATTAETGTTATQIKAWLQTAYSSWPVPPEFVAFAGDASGTYSIPTWVENLSGYSGEGDFPYSQLAGGDWIPDVHLGRLSFSSLNELDIIVAKTVGYESTPYMTDTSWFTRACLVGDPSQSGISTIQVQQWIKSRLRDMGYSSIDTVFSGNFPGLMTTALNRGDTFFCYRGWLGMSGWTNTNTYALTNGWKMPFAVISTCGTGSFASGTSLSESFLRAGSINGGVVNPTAGIGSIGTATTGTHTRFNNCLTLGVYQAELYENLWEMGAALTRGKMELYLNYYGRTNPDYATIFSYWNNLMGDPGCPIFTGVPQTLNVNAPVSVPLGTNSMTVTVTKSGVPEPDAQVCLWKGTETWVVGRTDAAGHCELPLNLATGGNVLLTVTKHDRQPYLTSIPVITPALFVGYLGSAVDDDNVGTSHGNGDGAVNPLEGIELRVQVKNFGTQSASNVTATLTSADPYVTITDNQETFGTISGGATAWSADDFDFEVAGGCPDGHILRFGLDVTSGSNTWHSLVEVPAVSAALTAGGYTLYNAGPNGLLDPGESVGLSVRVKNTGGSAANGVTGTLSSLSPWITVTDATGTYGNIAAGGNGENTTDRFGVSANPGTYQGHLAFFSLATTFNSGAMDTTVVSVPVGERSSDDPIGPDLYGYYAFDNTDTSYPDAPVYNWIEIDPSLGGSGSEIVLGDYGDSQDKSRAVDMPFAFQFYGRAFNRATVCSNGWMAMGDTYLTDYRNWSIPGAGSPEDLLAVFWDELYQQTESKCWQYYDAANHRWIVEWSRFRNLVGGNPVETFQVILYDPAYYHTDSGDGAIVYQYNAVANVDGTDGYATVGIQNQDHTDGLLYTYFNVYSPGAATLQAGRAIRFLPVSAHPMGVLQGMVRNAGNNGPIEGAEVRVVQNGRTFLTGADGRYSGGVEAGTFTVVASHAGFAPDTVQSVVVIENQTSNADFALTDIAGPEITGVTQIGTTTDTAGPYVIHATAEDGSGISQVKLFYRIGGGAWEQAEMTAQGGEYLGSITGMPAGIQVDYYVWAKDASGNAATAPPDAPATFYTFYVTQVFYTTDCEDPGDPAWQIGVEGDNATTGLWVRDDPVGTEYPVGSGVPVQAEDDHTPDPGVKCFVTGNGSVGGAAGDQDVDGGCTTLQSPVFDLSTATQAFVGYWRWYALAGNSIDDTWAVDVSSDGGGTWLPLERLSENRNSWEKVTVDLGTLIPLTGQVVFRFVACDLNAAGLVEAAVDDFSLETFTPNTTGVEGSIRPVFGLGQNRPNPFRGSTAITFSQERTGPARLAIYDVQGRTVRHLVNGTRPAGAHTVLWDGRDDRGATVSSGLYFYKLQADGRTEVRKLIRLE